MSLHRNQYRAFYAALIVAAFFIPAYDKVSAFQFLWVAVDSIDNDTELTFIDLMVVLIPLLLIPFTAVLILFRAIRNKSQNSLLLGLPFFSLIFFFLLLSFDMSQQASTLNALELLKQMQVGFYIAALASLLLLLSYSRRESLNLH